MCICTRQPQKCSIVVESKGCWIYRMYISVYLRCSSGVLSFARPSFVDLYICNGVEVAEISSLAGTTTREGPTLCDMGSNSIESERLYLRHIGWVLLLTPDHDCNLG